MAFPSARPWPATYPHRTGVPARVLPLALLILALPFLLPGDVSAPEAGVAAMGAIILASAGLDHPRFSPARGHWLTAALAFAALVLVAGQTLLDRPPAPPLLGLPSVEEPRTAAPAKPTRGKKEHVKRPHAQRTGAGAAPAHAAPPASAPSSPAPASAAPTPSPTLREGTPVSADAERFVRDYYAALDRRRFATAWRMLTPGVQAAFGGFARWRAGYARTVANSPGSLRVTPAGGGATVGLTLRAGDRDGCGQTAVRRFAVTWRLARTEAGWRATAASARVLSGPVPAASC